MGLFFVPYHHHNPTLLHKPLFSAPFSSKRLPKVLPCQYSSSSSLEKDTKPTHRSLHSEGRRALIGSLLTSAAGIYVCDVAQAVSTSRRALRGSKIPEEEFTTLPNGLKYYDLKVGNGTEAVKGSRVAVHYAAKWKGITFMTSRQGLGAGGGTANLRGDQAQGVRYWCKRHVGRRPVPPELAYGSKGVQEIPPNATIELDVELLAIKQSPFGLSVSFTTVNQESEAQSHGKEGFSSLLVYSSLVYRRP